MSEGQQSLNLIATNIQDNIAPNQPKLSFVYENFSEQSTSGSIHVRRLIITNNSNLNSYTFGANEVSSAFTDPAFTTLRNTCDSRILGAGKMCYIDVQYKPTTDNQYVAVTISLPNANIPPQVFTAGKQSIIQTACSVNDAVSNQVNIANSNSQIIGMKLNSDVSACLLSLTACNSGFIRSSDGKSCNALPVMNAQVLPTTPLTMSAQYGQLYYVAGSSFSGSYSQVTFNLGTTQNATKINFFDTQSNCSNHKLLSCSGPSPSAPCIYYENPNSAFTITPGMTSVTASLYDLPSANSPEYPPGFPNGPTKTIYAYYTNSVSTTSCIPVGPLRADVRAPMGAGSSFPAQVIGMTLPPVKFGINGVYMSDAESGLAEVAWGIKTFNINESSGQASGNNLVPNIKAYQDITNQVLAPDMFGANQMQQISIPNTLSGTYSSSAQLVIVVRVKDKVGNTAYFNSTYWNVPCPDTLITNGVCSGY